MKYSVSNVQWDKSKRLIDERKIKVSKFKKRDMLCSTIGMFLKKYKSQYLQITIVDLEEVNS